MSHLSTDSRPQRRALQTSPRENRMGDAKAGGKLASHCFSGGSSGGDFSKLSTADNAQRETQSMSLIVSQKLCPLQWAASGRKLFRKTAIF